jgi:CheY-like chemotaxis protein
MHYRYTVHSMSRVLALVDDLLFLSRIREAARGAGAEVRAVRGPADLVASARDGGRLVLVDADSSRIPWSEAVSALRSDPSLAPLPVVAFLSHVHAERAERARAAGCTRVLARGAFVQELPRLIAAATRDETPGTLQENDL